MLAELRSRSQITIPSEIIKKLGISEGDKFEVTEMNGGIFLCPVVVYPKNKVEELAGIIKDYENDSNKKTYASIENMFSDMGIDLKNV